MRDRVCGAGATCSTSTSKWRCCCAPRSYPVRYSGQYDIDIYAFTTPFTYAFLHGGLAHLAINMVWLAAFGSPLANRLGTLRFALFWVVTALAAAGLHWAIYPLDPAPLVGASGAISGMMGAAARFGFNMDRRSGRAAFAGPALPVSEVLRSRNVDDFSGSLDDRQPCHRPGRRRAGCGRNDSLGGPYRRFPGRLPWPAVFSPESPLIDRRNVGKSVASNTCNGSVGKAR